MNTTVTTASAVDSLIGVYRSHVLGRALPAPVAVQFHPKSREITVQPEGGLDLARKLGNILLWAYTLAEVTAEWSHTDTGRFHVEVTGRTGCGASLTVYGGGAFDACLGLVSLAHGATEGVSLDELYALVGLLREAQHEREVA